MAEDQRAAPWVRVIIMLVLLVSTATVASFSLHFTGSLLPQDPRQALRKMGSSQMGSSLLLTHGR